MSELLVLGIETSCDDTSVCLLKGQSGIYGSFPQVLAHNAFSQETMLSKWGGVVPEIAARNHLEKIAPLLEQTFKEAALKPSDIDLIAVTTNPGLLGPLLTGINAAKAMSLLHHKAIFPVNHLYAHLEAVHLTEKVGYPYLGLLVSGGHSLYLLVRSPSEFEMLGTTIDDAAGEAFDKGGKLMGLGYPAGRLIDELAKKGEKTRFKFPIGLRSPGNADLSFSGVKTSLRLFLEENPGYFCQDKENPNQDHFDVCASYQECIVAALSLKLGYAVKIAKEKYSLSHLPIVVGGGVACNSALRERLQKDCKSIYFVKPSFCTDNGAMIANYGLRRADEAITFPECLELDAKERFLDKSKVQERV